MIDYNVSQPATPDSYYTVWETYIPSQKRHTPSYDFSQARHEQGLYPMDWNYHGAKKLVADIQVKNSSTKAKARRDRAESAVVRQYSKQMFEHALKDLTEHSECGRRFSLQHNRNSKLLTVRDRPRTTGPTRQGSPIYNQRTGLLNRLRTRTGTYQDLSSFEDLSLIRHNIALYNQKFHLVANNSAEKLDITNAKFIDKETLSHRESSAEDQEICNEESLDHFAGPLVRVTTTSNQKYVSEPPPTPNALHEPASLPQLMVSMQETDNKDSQNVALRNTQSDSLLQVTSRSRPVSARSGRSSIVSDRSSRAPQVRTWVDDASVSSDGAKSVAGSERVQSAKSKLQEAAADTFVHPVLPEPQPMPLAAEVQEGDIEEDEPDQLPELVCPSSEDKSRAYAVLLWLAKCDFDSAMRSIPLT